MIWVCEQYAFAACSLGGSIPRRLSRRSDRFWARSAVSLGVLLSGFKLNTERLTVDTLAPQ